MVDRGFVLRALLPLGALAAPCLSAASLVAWKLGYHPYLGRPWLGFLYPPSWVLRWYAMGWADGARQDAFVDGLLWALATAVPFVAAMLLLGPPGGGRGPFEREAGALLATARDLLKAGGFGHAPPGIPVGLDGRRVLFRSGDKLLHTLLLGPTGIGKGVSTVVPLLLTWTHSAIVKDPKPELCQRTGRWRSRLGPVHCVKIDDPRSARYNPLLSIRADDGNPSAGPIVTDAQTLAEMLAHAGEPDGARQVLGRRHDPGGDRAPDRGAPLARADDRDLLQDDARAHGRPRAGLRAPLRPQRPAPGLDDLAGEDARLRVRQPRGQARLPRQPARPGRAVRRRLPRRRPPGRAEAGDRLRLHAARRRRRDAAAAPAADRVPAAPADVRPEAHARRPAKLRPVAVVWDEFPADGRIPAFETYAANLRGFDVWLVLAAQDQDAIDRIYGPRNAIPVNCRLRLYSASLSESSLRREQELAGTAVTVRHGRSRDGGLLGRTTRSETEITGPVVDKGELQAVAESHVVVFAPGMRRPALVPKLRYHEHPAFAGRYDGEDGPLHGLCAEERPLPACDWDAGDPPIVIDLDEDQREALAAAAEKDETLDETATRLLANVARRAAAAKAGRAAPSAHRPRCAAPPPQASV